MRAPVGGQAAEGDVECLGQPLRPRLRVHAEHRLAVAARDGVAQRDERGARDAAATHPARPAARVIAPRRSASCSPSCPAPGASASCRPCARGRSSGPPSRGRARPGPAPCTAGRGSPARAAERPPPGPSSIPASRSSRPTSRRRGSSSTVPPAAQRVVVVRAGVDDAGARGGSRAGAGRRVVGVEAELQHDHAREAEPVAQPAHGRRDHAEVLGDRAGARPSRGRARVEQRAPRPARQRPPRASRAPGGHRPVGDEAAEVVDPREVEELEGAPRRAIHQR